MLNANTSRFALAGHDLKCVQRRKNRLRRIILGLSWLFLFRFRKNRIQNIESLKECDFPILINQNIPTAFRHFIIVDTLLKDRNSVHTEKTLTVYCLLFRIRPPKRALSINIINSFPSGVVFSRRRSREPFSHL